MRIAIVTFLGMLLSGCVTIPTDAGLARTVLDTRAGIGEAIGAHGALTSVFEGKDAMTEDAKSELAGAATELRYANGLFYLKAVPLLAAGAERKESALKALQDVRTHTASAKDRLTKAEAALREKVK